MDTEMKNQGPRPRSEVATQEPESTSEQQQANAPRDQVGSENWLFDLGPLSSGQPGGDERPQASIAPGRGISQAFDFNPEDVINEDDYTFYTTQDFNDDDDDVVNFDSGADSDQIGTPDNNTHEEFERVKGISTSAMDIDAISSDGNDTPTSEEDGRYRKKRFSKWTDNGLENHEDKGALFLPGSFASLQANPSPPGAHSLNQIYERTLWRIVELEENRRRVERRLNKAIKRREFTEKKLESSYVDYYLKVKDLGISKELWKEYRAFCESMEPQFGTRTGQSIICDEDHEGSYIGYDPEMVHFKEFCEYPLDQYNFRCEASVQADSPRPTVGVPVMDLYVVEFWRVPRLSTDLNLTSWRDVYPELYRLATKAAREGSEAALDMLVALPDQDETCRAGWLFEYSKEKPTTYSDVSDAGNTWPKRQWVYRSAHRTIGPAEDVATKRKRIQEFLKFAE
ncbi:hypothetical protein NUW58_g8562 [Xylaria curta]|uniref:Uncharacterized protein n=1 Tax=Xylaria curta TaxID=42375 RepID=A0ACC1N626_9PEZI|nr:hypothetical protein NUW58_g8562 [Xylaria curta]